MTRFAFERLDAPCDTILSPALDESRRLSVLTYLAADLLAARARGDDPCQRAPTFTALTTAGLTAADCLALISEGLLAPLPAGSAERRPTGHSPSASANGRGDGRSKSLPGKKSSTAAGKPHQLGQRTRLLLTDAGLAFVTKRAQSSRIDSEPSSAEVGGGDGGQPAVAFSLPSCFYSSRLLPHYEIDLRELSVAGVVILRLPVQARNLAAALAALQLSGWKPRVAKPLNGCRGGNDRHHVGIAAYKLHHRQSLIEFHADDGGLRWNWRSTG